MANYIIYLTTNLKSEVDGQLRKYIGIHRTDNPNVFSGYIGCGVNIYKPSTYMYPKTPFQYAVKKYGTDAFKTETLFIFNNAKDALKKEAELVDENWIKQSWTYNVLLGGGGYKDYWRPIYQFDFDGNLVKEWESVLDASDFYGEGLQRFYNALYNHRSLMEYFWSYDKEINIKNYSHNRLKHQVHLYDSKGKYLMEFESRKACAEYLGCNPQSVSNGIRNQCTIKNHFISDSIVDLFVPKPRIQLKGQTFYLYKDGGEFLGKFYEKEILTPIGEHSWSKISSALNANLGWYKNFYISLEPVDKVPEKLGRRRKSVEVYDKVGNLIEKCPTVKSLCDKYNISFGDFDRIMKGAKHFNDYIFVYSK